MKDFISNDTAVFTTKFVLEENKLITFVEHTEEDGAWIFLSDDQFDDFEKVAKVVGFNEILALDTSLSQLSKMEEGYFALRRGDSWEIRKAK